MSLLEEIKKSIVNPPSTGIENILNNPKITKDDIRKSIDFLRTLPINPKENLQDAYPIEIYNKIEILLQKKLNGLTGGYYFKYLKYKSKCLKLQNQNSEKI